MFYQQGDRLFVAEHSNAFLAATITSLTPDLMELEYPDGQKEAIDLNNPKRKLYGLIKRPNLPKGRVREREAVALVRSAKPEILARLRRSMNLAPPATDADAFELLKAALLAAGTQVKLSTALTNLVDRRDELASGSMLRKHIRTVALKYGDLLVSPGRPDKGVVTNLYYLTEPYVVSAALRYASRNRATPVNSEVAGSSEENSKPQVFTPP